MTRQQQTKNDYLQKTNTYRPITRPVFVQPDLSQTQPTFDFNSVASASFLKGLTHEFGKKENDISPLYDFEQNRPRSNV